MLTHELPAKCLESRFILKARDVSLRLASAKPPAKTNWRKLSTQIRRSQIRFDLFEIGAASPHPLDGSPGVELGMRSPK